MPLPLVGIIANPASGRDIRRLVAHGTVFDNNEKTAIVRRVLLGMEAIGMMRVAYMPEHDFGIVPRALSVQHGQTPAFSLEAFPLAMPVTGTSSDSTCAARLLAELGAGCIITLGGDGTNRAVAKGCGTVPLIPLEGGEHSAVRRVPWLEVLVNGATVDHALVDVVVSSLPFIGSRAIWDLSTVREVVLSRVAPATIGLSALGGALLNSSHAGADAQPGMHIVLGQGRLQI